MDETEFRRGIRDRAPPAWARLERLYGHMIARQASLLLPAGMDPDNAVGEVWLKALKGARRYDPQRPPFPWLARICTNACLNQRRSLFRFLPRVLPDDAAGPASEEREGRTEAQRALRTALQRLPTREREIVALRFLFEISVDEIAVLLNVKANSVHQGLFRGLKRLREGPLAREFENATAPRVPGKE